MIDNRFAVDVQWFVRVDADADLADVRVNQTGIVPVLQVLQNVGQPSVREENQISNAHLENVIR